MKQKIFALATVVITLALSAADTLASTNRQSYPSVSNQRTTAIDRDRHYNDDDYYISMSIGGILGAGFKGQDRGASFNYGGRLNFSLDPATNFGVYYSRLRLFSNGINKTYANLLLAEGNWFVENREEGFYLGAKAGVGIIESDVELSTTRDSFALGPALGFEHTLARTQRTKVNAGVEANYIFLTSSDDPDIFGVLGSLRLIF